MNNEKRQLNENTGIAFYNKSENPNAPVIKGQINIEGKIYDIAYWENTSKIGMKYLTCKINLSNKEQK